MTFSVRSVIREELYMAGYGDAAMPPFDIDAEAGILSAIIDGHASHKDFAPLERKHFFSHILGAIYESADGVLFDGTTAPIEELNQRLIWKGWRGALEEELERVAYCQPFRALEFLKASSCHLLELYARREMIKALRGVESRLRLGVISADNAAMEIQAWLANNLAR